ncbi:MAG: preprotein translocase subunit SecA [Deltaproteobacteria bacterium]|nr:preprotein translocase subunit SecA [Deltaproteobacteria bacterium]
MLSQLTNIAPADHVLRPERKDHDRRILDIISKRIFEAFSSAYYSRDSWASSFLRQVKKYGQEFETTKDDGIIDNAHLLRDLILREGFRTKHIARSFALIREVSSRTLGLRHFNTQITGGRVLLMGKIAEMETGEGKTLTAVLAAGTAALAGVPVHIITVNDYLTGRDAEMMGPVYRALGLTVGRVIHGMSPEERRVAYECDVTYCTNKEIAFDYLKDWIVLEGSRNPLRLHAEYLYGYDSRVRRLILRGLYFGIVDEADSILIDEARTPLIISKKPGDSGEERVFLEQAIEIAGKLEPGVDFLINKKERKIEITDKGERHIKEASSGIGPIWSGTVRRKETIDRALTALHLFKRDEHYMVRDGKVQIIDEFTGRSMPDRSYERGLHQLIELKEGCEITRRAETLARISYQRFFRRYIHLAGMTGTAREVKGELLSVYGLSVVSIPTHKKMRRVEYPATVFPTDTEKWQAIVSRIIKMNREGRPVLLGTRSVKASEHASRLLEHEGLLFRVLNAKQDKEEAEIISHAGEKGVITIATNMAGRGTDIKLGQKVEEIGGLHVILTERHDAGRIDRQLAGRCGRLGDPGSHEAILSLEDPLLEGGRGGLFIWFIKGFAIRNSKLWSWFAGRAILHAQKKMERLHAQMRKSLLREDERRGDMLSFSGRSE